MAITTFDKVLDEFSAALVKESVGRTYAADSLEEAEWDGFFGVFWVARCFEEVLRANVAKACAKLEIINFPSYFVCS